MLHNQILANKKTKKKLPSILISFGLFAFFCIVSVFGFYGVSFKDFSIIADTEKFGQFGDFIGGTLNPILAFLSFMALLYTIKIQTDELKLSREELEATRNELKESRIAQQEQSESLKLQNHSTKLQMFENTYFQLINLFTEIRKEFHINLNNRGSGTFKLLSNNDRIRLDSSEANLKYDGKESIVIYLEIMKQQYKSNYDYFNRYYEENTGTYFGQIYQILKFMKDSNIENKQRYVNIFRAQFTKDELEFLFYHCMGIIGKRRFKKLVEDYEFFEHMILNENIEKQLLEYDINAFGKNENILKKYNELKEKA